MKKIDFKNIKKRYYVLAVILILFIISAFVVLYFSFDPSDDFNAMICNSVTKDNNGYIYCYNIYAKDNNHYTYIETKRKIKDDKYKSFSRVKSGKINSSEDFDKLVKSLEKNNKKGYNSLISYTYVDNGENYYYDSSELMKKLLFKE